MVVIPLALPPHVEAEKNVTRRGIVFSRQSKTYSGIGWSVMFDQAEQTGTRVKPPLIGGGRAMATLTVIAGEGVGRRVDCRRIVCLVGSRHGCKVNLQHPGVAPVHVAIVHMGDRIMACDLASVRGSRLNGLPLVQEELADGDVLAVGPWEFRVGLTVAPGGADAIAHPDLDPTPREFSLEHVATRRGFQPRCNVCIIGRRSKCDIAIDDADVSRVHALLFRYDDRPAIMDLLATLPLRVNGQEVGFRFLEAEDVLGIGGSEFRVRFPKMLKAAANGNGDVHEDAAAPTMPIRDLVDIRAVEAGQTWHVADRLERIQRDQEDRLEHQRS